MKAILILITLILFSSCSSIKKIGSLTSYGPKVGPTPYQAITAKNDQGGYEEKYNPNKGTYTVRFVGNGYTMEDTVLKYLIRRCEEIRIMKGYNHYKVIRAKTVPWQTKIMRKSYGYKKVVMWYAEAEIQLMNTKPEEMERLPAMLK